MNHEKSPCYDCHNIHQTIKQSCGKIEDRHDLIAFFLQFLHDLITGSKLLHFHLFRRKCLDYPLSKQRIFHLRIEFTNLHTLCLCRRSESMIQLDAEIHHKWYAGKDNQSQRQ